MGIKTWRLACVGSAFLVLVLARWAPAEDELAGSTAENRAAGYSLTDLGRLEALQGNGGADESTTGLSAGWDAKEGFYLSDAERQNFLLRIGGRLQVRYTYKGRDRRGSGDPANDLDRSYFELERARIKLQGYVLDPNLIYFVQLDGDTDGGGSVRTLDAYVAYKFGEYFSENPDLISIGVGQWKPYFLRQEATSSGKLQMVERSLTNEFFNIDRNLGAWVQGYLHPVFYSFAVTNGFDSANVSSGNVDQIPAFIGKLDLNILGEEGGRYEEGNVKMLEDPLWVIGGSFATDQNNGTRETASTQEFKVYQFGVDTIFKWSLFSLQAEYMGRWLDYQAGNNVPGMGGSGATHYAHGFYVQGGLFIWPGVVELTGRVSTVWADGPQNGNGVEVGPGLNWYISKSHKVKLQTDLMYFDISGNLPVRSESLDTPDTDATAGELAAFSPFDSSAAGYVSGEQGVMWRVQLQLEF